MRYHLRAPATSANLGPGFDTLGVALGLYNDFFFEIAETTEVSGCAEEHCGPDNLFLHSFRIACDRLNHAAPELRLDIKASIPLARGLGSSAAMIAGGVGAAFALFDSIGPASRLRMLDIAAEIEGHPDNVAPAIYGGFCASISKGSGKHEAAHCPVAADWRFHALIPPFELPTSQARAALPASYPKADVVFNLGRAALISLAVSQKNLGLFGAACDDRIHQPYRKDLIPGWDALTAACRRAGASALWLSGAGPTIMAVGTSKEAEAFEREIRKSLARPEGIWRLETLAADPRGLRILR